MTDFTTDGYLSDEMNRLEAEILTRYAAKLDVASNTNRETHRAIYAIKIGSDRLSDLLLATLLARQSETFQAFLLLMRKGMIHQSEILLRNVAESMFLVGAIFKDHAFAERYVLSEEISRKRSLTRLNQDRLRRGQPPDAAAVSLIAELDKKARDEGIRKFTTEQVAEMAGLSSYYDTLYGLLSLAVHSSSRSHDKALTPDATGKVVSVEYAPTVEGFDMHLDYAISMMLYTLHDIATYFSEDVSQIEELQRRNQQLAGNA